MAAITCRLRNRHDLHSVLPEEPAYQSLVKRAAGESTDQRRHKRNEKLVRSIRETVIAEPGENREQYGVQSHVPD